MEPVIVKILEVLNVPTATLAVNLLNPISAIKPPSSMLIISSFWGKSPSKGSLMQAEKLIRTTKAIIHF